ncbi:aminoglycoside phosphotransferase family protein [Actinoplanes sp. NPDC049681]|uniref:aminoglycoside phosphotransferase family protein n=1 Tax=Actinoplanes sp. NPDC049681 TaxID=3363905 RepID=UPI00379781D1
MTGTTVPEATAVRPRWTTALPATLLATLESRLGAPTVHAVDQTGGFTHGLAARLTLADGRRVFAKAMPADDELAPAYRAEAWCAARLPAAVPASRLEFSLQADGWVVLVFADVEGRNPDLSEPGELAAVLSAFERLAEVLTPNPLPEAPTCEAELRPLVDVWRQYATDGPPADLDPWARRNLDRLVELESHWVAATAGDTLLHFDLRPDNMLLTAAGEVLTVDWACACVGAAWVDLLVLLGSVDGLDGEQIVRSHPVTRDVPAEAIDAFLCALAGLWARESRKPELPRSPYLRRFQARNGELTLGWLAHRTGWR